MITPLLETFECKAISDETYFSNEYVEYISNSRLSLINPAQDGSPEKYLANEHKFSSALSLGSAVHELILEPNEFRLVESTSKPTSKMGLMADYLYPYYKENKTVTDEQVIEASNAVDYYKGKMNQDKIDNVQIKCTPYWQARILHEIKVGDLREPIFLDDASLQKCKQCVESVKKNTQIQSLLHPEGFLDEPIIKNECALFIDFLYTEDDKECILKFKGKLDNFTIDKEDGKIVLNDLKTTGHYIDKFHDSFEKYHYYRQLAIYTYLLKLYAAQYLDNINSVNCNLLLVSTVPDFQSAVFKVTEKDIERGWIEFVKLMNMVGHVVLREQI